MEPPATNNNRADNNDLEEDTGECVGERARVWRRGVT